LHLLTKIGNLYIRKLEWGVRDMEQFIQPIQYNILKEQAKKLVNGLGVTKDKAVIKALKELVQEKNSEAFTDLNKEQKLLIDKILDLENKEQLEAFLKELRTLVIPFPEVSEHSIKKFFPKDKKLKAPKQSVEERIGSVYFCITDNGTNRKYIIYEKDGQLHGRRGTYGNQVKKGICAICNHLEDVTMFMVSSKKGNEGTFTKQGNTICVDSIRCNENITDASKLTEFLSGLK
jgi:hypothetical protein